MGSGGRGGCSTPSFTSEVDLKSNTNQNEIQRISVVTEGGLRSVPLLYFGRPPANPL